MPGPEQPTRWRVGLVLVRALVSASLVVVAYYVVPLRPTIDLDTFLRLLVGLGVLTGLIAWQLPAIVRSPYPTLRAVETLATAVPLFLVLFAGTYVLMSQAAPASFTESLTRTDALYFTVTVFATVGFGDIAPSTPPARIVVTVQMIADLLLLGVVLRAVVGAVERGRRARGRGRDPE